MKQDDLCSPCYWGECMEKPDCCLGLCICRCRPRRPVSDSTNAFVRDRLAKELRAYSYAHQAVLNSYQREGLTIAAGLIERGEI